MFTNVNLAAPIGVVAFLGSGLVLAIVALGFIVFAIKHLLRLKRLSLVLAVAIVIVYLCAMLVFSIKSQNQVLVSGQEKHFCEIDCHLAYSITEAHQTSHVGATQTETKAAGNFYVVTVKTRFDETTISPSRGNGLLYPNGRSLTLIDSSGHRYYPSASAQRSLEAAGQAGTPITTPLRPGESYLSTFVFDVPTGTSSPQLLINENEWITHLIIGHENSLAHKKTLFQL